MGCGEWIGGWGARIEMVNQSSGYCGVQANECDEMYTHVAEEEI